MDNVLVKIYKKPKLKNPILIEGLPGVGNVGKLAAEYLVSKLNAEKFAEIYSKYFPPQVLINDDGTLYLVKNELYYLKTRGKSDLIFLVGDYQGLSNEGQFELSYRVLEIAKMMNVKFIYTLGGFGTGQLTDQPRVFGAATNVEIVEKLKNHNVVFSSGEPSNGIVGAAGLLLGLGMNFFDMEGACLMGETSGYFTDPKGAMAVLKVLVRILKLNVDFKDLEARIQALNELTQKMQEQVEQKVKKEDLGYIG
ncbi:MAG TPA: proteasome assembly chaperone family protein [Euryarchaeota archaeon]|nr:proteasome assembly chaperone family protein [Euryarchaeota archaeon]